MQETKGLLNGIKQHDKLAIRVSSNVDASLPPEIVEKLLKTHKTAFYFFLFIDKGTSTHKIDLHEQTVSDGQILFVLPNQIHTLPKSKNENEYFKISFDENCLSLLPQQFSFLINPLNTSIISFDNASKQRVKSLFENLNQLLHSDNDQKNATIILAHLNSLMTECDIAYFKNITKENAQSHKIQKYIEFKVAVETHLTEQQTIHTIADNLSVTTNNLYNIVKEFSGVSPKEFIINRLMLEAQRKLHYSKPSIKELAYELGFNDPDYFSRLFKKSTGKSVSNYLADIQDLSSN
jgi:AraC family transcriptional regulator, transcriptional activator of pobA